MLWDCAHRAKSRRSGNTAMLIDDSFGLGANQLEERRFLWRPDEDDERLRQPPLQVLLQVPQQLPPALHRPCLVIVGRSRGRTPPFIMR